MFARRKAKKLIKHVLHESRHARHMREDIADPELLARLGQAEEALVKTYNENAAYETIEEAAETVISISRQIYPVSKHGRARENFEILIVAVAVAMGFRAYFLQPFKIPTGSMQPTLYGITFERQDSKNWYDVFPINLVNFILTGDRMIEVKSRDSGQLTVDIRNFNNSDTQFFYIRIGTKVHKLRRGIPLLVQPGEYVSKGQVFAAGRMSHGDHIFVNKMKYNFGRPKRGEVFVFKTRNIEYPDMDRNTFYIKRLVGMPGEQIQIKDRIIHADGNPVTDPPSFKRMLEDPAYPHGWSYAGATGRGTLLSNSRSVLQLDEDQYLPMGDNTDASLDGRYFGGVDKHDVVGPAFSVYWPFGKRWGFIN